MRQAPSAVNPANALTVLRLLLVPVFVTLLAAGRTHAALWVFVAASVTDFLDGLAARLFDVRTQLGAALDVTADKLLLVSAYVALPFLPHAVETPLVIACSVSVVLRHVVLVGLWLAGRTLGRAVLLPPTWMGKASTALQMVLVGCVLLPVEGGWLRWLFHATVFATFYSGGEYLWEGFARVRTSRRARFLAR